MSNQSKFHWADPDGRHWQRILQESRMDVDVASQRYWLEMDVHAQSLLPPLSPSSTSPRRLPVVQNLPKPTSGFRAAEKAPVHESVEQIQRRTNIGVIPDFIERWVIRIITLMDPDAPVNRRMVVAYIVDVLTSIVTAMTLSWGKAVMDVVFTLAINIGGSFAELIARYALTTLQTLVPLTATKWGDEFLLWGAKFWSVFLICASIFGYGFNIVMTARFFDLFSGEKLVLMGQPMQFGLGAVIGVIVVGLMSLAQLEYHIKRIFKV